LNVRLDTIQKEPELVRAFVRGMVKGLKFTYAHPDQAAEIAKQQFPTMPLEDLKATLDRSFRDEMWSKDGMISKEAWATGSAVVRGAGILKTDVKYEEIIDMSLVESVRESFGADNAEHPNPSPHPKRATSCQSPSGTSPSPSATKRC